ncbi:MAG: hotdog domain-containing protein [Pseudomonadota bacterium]|jgi:acyl-CoA thioesterase YciA|uniref:Thioesterase superfamily n=2 Tax=Methylophaga TaxID=40222 RepID=F5SW53_9GAMM|nr:MULTISPECIES: hotdog domain-containing protein [Methylophaga]MEC9411826.1 hotdog domain-containing protein [Pseudomonadota bacterium]EGL55774.1 thioesterase superfamily [Methylophaga aminisulfidivorans MP]GLP98620.1 acyl-CoA thioesterase [Methylophaga thalassica]HIC47255.1 acyl-CoA thioesterase [Methylophaga sp.]HIM40629.1 acyl-CoA thioesterase [Methylophaga aminisulfidivorans]
MELPQDKHAVLRIMARPSDVNIAGDIFGGWLMSQCDIAGGIYASRLAGGRVVTVAVNNFQFIAPVLVADIVSIYVDTIRIGTTSITVKVTVLIERRDGKNETTMKVAEADIVYVHIDENRQPAAITQE